MASIWGRSPKYRVDVKYIGKDVMTQYDRWEVVVMQTKPFFFSSYVGESGIIWENPTDEQVELIARKVIDQFLTNKEKSKPRTRYVRHP